MLFSTKPTMILATLTALAVIPRTRGAVIDVTVGGPGILKFQPESVNANVGDVVRFTFKQKNHTVTQSSLASPCSAMQGGFNSGFVPVADDVNSDFPIAELNVDDTNPIWAYCAQQGHCQQGMVFAVNPGDKMAQFQAAATGGASSAAPQASGQVTVTQTITQGGSAMTTTYTTDPAAAASATASSAAGPTDHKIIVGGPGKLYFEPSNITASPGDTVTFEFHQKSHSVTQSSFGQPCSPISATNASAQGFDSGIMPVADDATSFPTYQVKVNDTNPVWGYCKFQNHCSFAGMVFSINANEASANTFAAFQAKAKSSGASGSASAGASATNAAGASTSNQPSRALKTLDMRGAGIAMSLIGLLAGSFVL